MPSNRIRRPWMFAIQSSGALVSVSTRQAAKGYFLHHQVDGKRVWHLIGDPRDMTLPCARERATSLLASRSRTDEVSPDATSAVLFEVVANEVFKRYKRHWKPSTLEVNQCYYKEPDPAVGSRVAP